MWTWRVSRACFTGATVLAALAFAGASLRMAQADNDAESNLAGTLELVTWGFVGAALALLSLSALFASITVIWWFRRWWTPVNVRGTDRYFTVWTNKPLVELSGVHGEFREHVSGEVEQTADVRIGGQVARLIATSRREISGFPQTPFSVQSPPEQGATVEVTLRFRPKLW